MEAMTFGDDLAFAGIDTPSMIGKVENGRIVVTVAHNGASAIITNFTSVKQADEAIAIAQRATASLYLCADDEMFDLAVGILSMLADKSFILPQPLGEDDMSDEEIEAYNQYLDADIEAWQMERHGIEL